jgi:hypothetical protein
MEKKQLGLFDKKEIEESDPLLLIIPNGYDSSYHVKYPNCVEELYRKYVENHAGTFRLMSDSYLCRCGAKIIIYFICVYNDDIYQKRYEDYNVIAFKTFGGFCPLCGEGFVFRLHEELNLRKILCILNI